jgi:hypothetical protein
MCKSVSLGCCRLREKERERESERERERTNRCEFLQTSVQTIIAVIVCVLCVRGRRRDGRRQRKKKEERGKEEREERGKEEREERKKLSLRQVSLHVCFSGYLVSLVT